MSGRDLLEFAPLSPIACMQSWCHYSQQNLQLLLLDLLLSHKAPYHPQVRTTSFWTTFVQAPRSSHYVRTHKCLQRGPASRKVKKPREGFGLESIMQPSSAPSGYQDPTHPLDDPSCLFLTALARETRFQIYNHFVLQYNLIHIVQPFTRKGLLSRRCALEVPDIDPRPGHFSSPTSDLNDSEEPPLVYEGNKQIIQDRRWCPFERAYELPNYDTRAVLLIVPEHSLPPGHRCRPECAQGPAQCKFARSQR